MKVRWLLVASLFMAIFAVASVSNVSAAPSVVTEYKIGLGPQPDSPSQFAHGVADYKVYAGGGRSLAYSVQGAQAYRFQKLYASVADQSVPSPGGLTNVCTFHVDVHGNGGCIADTRTGAPVPTITSGGQFQAGITTSPNYQPGNGFVVVYGTFQ